MISIFVFFFTKIAFLHKMLYSGFDDVLLFMIVLFSALDVVWVSTYTFLVAYISKGADCSDQPQVILVNGGVSQSSPFIYTKLSRIMRKQDFGLCEKKGADQLRSDCEADQCLCFRYSDSTISLLLLAKISSPYPASETLQANLCCTWSKTPKTGFLTSRLN